MQYVPYTIQFFFNRKYGEKKSKIEGIKQKELWY